VEVRGDVEVEVQEQVVRGWIHWGKYQ